MASSKNFEKLMDEIGSMTVIELSDFVKAFEEKFNVSAAAPVAVSAVGAPVAAAAEVKSHFKVTLQDSGAEKIKVIKAVRLFKKDIGITEAKKLVEETPTVLAESVSKDEAEKMKKELEAAGAKVELS